ncbi:MAG: hypothetical protein GF308_20350 [Candidatus Heimdallarchaeota archaeon]|nr:hypothetical protein [Candidatus Heimdallarchaeota archaeon]
MSKLHCFVYMKDKDDFQQIEKDELAEEYFNHLQQKPEKLEEFAETNGSDAVLLFDIKDQQWILVYAKDSGIVTQRTARRRADSVSRAGILLTSGERIGVRAPLTVLSDSNIGELSKSVQSKYLPTTNLRGVE